jgi:hypothetical protein
MIEDARTIAGAATTPGMPRSTARRVGFIGQASRLHSPGSPGRAASFDHRSTRRLVAVMSQGHPAFVMLERRIIEIRDWVNCGKSKQSAARLRLEKNRPGGECVPGPSSHSHHGDKSTDVEQVQRVALRGLSARRPC